MNSQRLSWRQLILHAQIMSSRCPPLLEIALRTLRGYLAASRAMLHEHVLDHPWLVQQGSHHNNNHQKSVTVPYSLDVERDELRNALVYAQESAAVQILLDVIAVKKQTAGIVSTVSVSDDESLTCVLLGLFFFVNAFLFLFFKGNMRNTAEVRSLICSHLHQVFIAEPYLVKLVHFQGYSKELLPFTIRGIPSMHICLDFLPELITTSDVDRLVFAACLLSHVSAQYALPKAFSISRLAMAVVSTLVSGNLSNQPCLGSVSRPFQVHHFPSRFSPFPSAFVKLCAGRVVRGPADAHTPGCDVSATSRRNRRHLRPVWTGCPVRAGRDRPPQAPSFSFRFGFSTSCPSFPGVRTIHLSVYIQC